jgi:hypothetical protein
LAAFPDTPAVDHDQSWYRDLTDNAPQESVKRGHERYEKGPSAGMEGVELTVAVDLLRISLTVAPRVTPNFLSEQDPAERMPTLGPFPPARDGFVKLMTRWLTGQHPPLRRLAFAGKLIQITPSKESAYQDLGKYLPDIKLSPNSSDFIYRINRPRASTSGIRKLQMNRLSTWSVSKFMLQAHGVLGTGEVMPQQVAAELFAVSLEFDINTGWEFKELLPVRKQVLLLRECAQLATELAECGDIP